MSLTTGLTGDSRDLKQHTIKDEWNIPTGFMDMSYCYIMSPLPVTACGTPDVLTYCFYTTFFSFINGVLFQYMDM